MKNQFILWTSAFAITFIFGYLNRITSSDYPITGTVKYNTYKVSYLFDRVYRGDDNYKFQIFTNLKDLKGKLQFKNIGEKNWEEIKLQKGENIFFEYLPVQKPGDKLIYRAVLEHNKEKIIVPKTDGVTITFWGRVSKPIMLFYNFSLLLGLFLTTRIGLEYFNENEKIKKLSLFPLFFFIFYGLFVVPVKHTYELGAFGKQILKIDQLFDIGSLAFLAVWIVTIILIFNFRKRKIISLISAIILLLFYGIDI